MDDGSSAGLEAGQSSGKLCHHGKWRLKVRLR